ncbi:MAG: hypothetical protein EHM59_03880 [Betaproteobacteria bacterium]|nr:MAG: hypothetical protein EHM59_03880 [Betaproteobacteria bacterium]
MGRSAKILCTVMAAFLLATGCTQQTYTLTSDAATREIKIKAGDQILVVTTRHEWLRFDVTEIRADRFVGVTSEFAYPDDSRPSGVSDKPVEVPFDELAVLQVTRFDAGAAARATAVVVVTITAIGAVIGAVAVPAAPLVVP